MLLQLLDLAQLALARLELLAAGGQAFLEDVLLEFAELVPELELLLGEAGDLEVLAQALVQILELAVFTPRLFLQRPRLVVKRLAT